MNDDRICIGEVIVVEGKYDKNTISGFIDAPIIETDGFGIFNQSEKRELLRRLADKRGLIVLTDSDGAGFVIRNFIRGCVDPSKVKHAYIPDVNGKEKRKARPSKEGKLGVEGMDREVIIAALKKCGAMVSDAKASDSVITKTDMFESGLSGRSGSAERRAVLKKTLSLPAGLSSNALLEVLNVLYSREEFFDLIQRLFPQDTPKE